MMGQSTMSIHGGEEEGCPHPVAPPIFQTASFSFSDVEEGVRAFANRDTYIYTRLGNPTIDLLEKRVALLEGAENGAASATGMGAITATLLGLLQAGDRLISSKYIYGCTYSLLTNQLPRWGVEVVLGDLNDRDWLERKLTEGARAVYFETPGNPLLTIIDIEEVAHLAHDKNALAIVDNTFATPILQKPILSGADIVIHSATKYLSGHGDTLGGIAVGSPAYIQPLKQGMVKDLGVVMSPLNAWLILRGMMTLPLRIHQQCQTSQKIADFLNQHPKVQKVYYPGLPEFPGYAVAKEQMEAFGAMLSFDLEGGLEEVKTFLSHLKVFTLAVSLGDVRSLIEHPWSMTHATVPNEEKKEIGIQESTLRISVGLEDAEDLLNSLDYALGTLVSRTRAVER